MTVTEFYMYNSGGLVYKDVNGDVLATGTRQDRAIPDPENNYGVFIHCANSDTQLYCRADGVQNLTFRLQDGTTSTVALLRDALLELLAENFFFVDNPTTPVGNLQSIFSAYLEQSGVLPPTVTILKQENITFFQPVYDAIGIFTLEFTGTPFALIQPEIMISPANETTAYFTAAYKNTNNKIRVQTWKQAGSLDNSLLKAYLTVKIYEP